MPLPTSEGLAQGEHSFGSISTLASLTVPFVAHKAGLAEQAIYSFKVPAAPERKHPAEGYISPAVIVVKIRGVASPQASKSLTIPRTLRSLDKLAI